MARRNRPNGKGAILRCDNAGCWWENYINVEFDNVYSQAKKDGWIVGLDTNRNYYHICPTCAKAGYWQLSLREVM